MTEKGGLVLKIKHTADSYNEDKKEGKVQAKKQIELEQNAAKAIMSLKHRRECNGEVTKFSWCSDPLCRMWYDMVQYFGFLGTDIIDTDIDNAIISVADGGTGIYERLIVLGHRILDAVGKEYAVKKYMSNGIEGIPKEINKIIGEGNKKLLIFLKMRWLSNNICSVSCLSKFAKRYCHYCKAELNSETNKWDEIKLSKYVKFCVSFCLYGQSIIDWNNPLNVESKLCQRFPWLEVLIRSMDVSIVNPSIQENGKFLSAEEIRNSRILGILWKYFGYKHEKNIPPRVLFALNTPEGLQLPEEKTGQMIFSHYISHYFKAVASEHGFTGVDTLHWVEKEKNALLQSNALELFALIDLELGEIYSNGAILKAEQKFSRYKGLFFSLIANMFVLSEEDTSAKMWIQELVASVRQVQLYILEYQEFISYEIGSKANIAQDEVIAITETSLDHTRTPEIFLNVEPEEIQSFINLLENYKSPAIIEAIKEIANVSKGCIDTVVDMVNIPQKWLKENLAKYVLYTKDKTRKEIGNCTQINLLKNMCNQDTLETEESSNSEINNKSIRSNKKKLGNKSRKRKIMNKKENKTEDMNHIHCPEILSPILKPVTLKLSQNHPSMELKPISLTFVDQEGKPVHYTLKPNSSSIPKGIIKPMQEVITRNDESSNTETSNSENEKYKHRSRSLQVFSRNIGRSRSPNYRVFERREHGIFGCEDVQQFSEMKNVNIYKDERDYMKYVDYNSLDNSQNKSYYRESKFGSIDDRFENVY